jgi:hypothetical protein
MTCGLRIPGLPAPPPPLVSCSGFNKNPLSRGYSYGGGAWEGGIYTIPHQLSLVLPLYPRPSRESVVLCCVVSVNQRMTQLPYNIPVDYGDHTDVIRDAGQSGAGATHAPAPLRWGMLASLGCIPNRRCYAIFSFFASRLIFGVSVLSVSALAGGELHSQQDSNGRS